jgi:Fur family transcriptional regulator, ferric uptake regulator
MKPHVHRRARAPLPDLTDRLRQESRKVTGPRQAILGVLRSSPHPLTIREVHAALGEQECDLATVYRSMHLLQTMGMVKRFDFGDGVARFELVCSEGDEHHHHLICTRCMEVVEIDECFPEEWERRIAQGNGFANISHKLEFFGVCPGCQRSE